MPDKRPSLSLSPAAEAFVSGAADEDNVGLRSSSPAEKPKAKARKPDVPKAPEKVQTLPMYDTGPLPPRHRVLSSGELKRRVTGFVTPELGSRLDEYMAAEERNVSWVLQRALTAWLEANA